MIQVKTDTGSDEHCFRSANRDASAALYKSLFLQYVQYVCAAAVYAIYELNDN